MNNTGNIVVLVSLCCALSLSPSRIAAHERILEWASQHSATLVVGSCFIGYLWYHHKDNQKQKQEILALKRRIDSLETNAKTLPTTLAQYATKEDLQNLASQSKSSYATHQAVQELTNRSEAIFATQQSVQELTSALDLRTAQRAHHPLMSMLQFITYYTDKKNRATAVDN